MSSTTIYLDLDDVICDTASAYTELVRDLFGKHYTLDMVHSFNLQKSFSLTEEENRLMFDMAHHRDFTMNLTPFEHAADTLGSWRECGFTIAIVTGRHTDAYRDTIDWLDAHDIVHDNLIMVDKYNRPSTDREIAISMKELSRMRFFCAVEDNTDMVNHLSTIMRVPVLLFDRPWNRKLAGTARTHRYHRWSEIVDIASLLRNMV